MLKLVALCIVIAVYSQSAEARKDYLNDGRIVAEIKKLPEAVFKVMPIASDKLKNKDDWEDLVKSMSYAMKQVMTDKDWTELSDEQFEDIYDEQIYWPCLEIRRLTSQYNMDDLPYHDERIDSMKKMADYCATFANTFEDYLAYYLRDEV